MRPVELKTLTRREQDRIQIDLLIEQCGANPNGNPHAKKAKSTGCAAN